MEIAVPTTKHTIASTTPFTPTNAKINGSTFPIPKDSRMVDANNVTSVPIKDVVFNNGQQRLAIVTDAADGIFVFRNREYPKVCVNLQTDVR